MKWGSMWWGRMPHGSRRSLAVALGIVVWWTFMNPKKKEKGQHSTSYNVLKRFVPNLGEDLRDKPIRFDMDFIGRFHFVLKTCFPTIWCRETALLTVLTVALFTRTYLTVLISDLMAKSVKNFVNRDFQGAKTQILVFQSLSLFAAFVNAGLKYITTMLDALIRDRMTRKAHDIYMENMNYYKVILERFLLDRESSFPLAFFSIGEPCGSTSP
jgi:hypothetical protein